MSRPPRIPNWLPWEKSTIYFKTFCVENRRSVLANETAWNICLSTLARLDRWTILAVFGMPDHLHLLTTPSADREASVSAFSKWFKRWFNDQYAISTDRTMTWCWQEGCFDRLLRSDESLSSKWEYLRQNPVRAGLVTDPDEWPYQFQYNEGQPLPSSQVLL